MMPAMPTPLPRLIKAILRGLCHLGAALLALLILFEEWGWEPLQRLMALLGRLPVLRRLEAAIAALPPRPALVVLLLPSLLLLPIKLLALGLVANGQAITGLGVVVAAKLLGTALVARLFALTRPALLQMPWFGRLYGRWVGWKGALLAQVRRTRVWRAGRAIKQAIKQAIWRRRRAQR